MFRLIRIVVLLIILIGVSVGSYLGNARSTDWNNTLYLKVYPINGDGSDTAARYIEALDVAEFAALETFMQRELRRYGQALKTPLRVRLGEPVAEQPPVVGDPGNPLSVAWWSLKMRWWSRSVTSSQDDAPPDVRMFVRYHSPADHFRLDNSVGLRKGMMGIVNAYAGRRQRGSNNFIIAHEFMHTLGASDKYDPSDGQPLVPQGLAEPGRTPLYPQRYAEIMGGRLALSVNESEMPQSLERARVGTATATEIGLY